MRNYLLLLTAIVTVAISSCQYDPFEDEEPLTELEFTNPFVRLTTGGVAGTIDVTVTNDTSGMATTPDVLVGIENLANVGGDLTVSYALGGSATYGEDYVVAENGSASGGTVFIPFENEGGGTAVTSGDIVFNILADTLVNGPETIVVTLTGVDSETGVAIDAGQGPLRRELTINLLNDDE